MRQNIFSMEYIFTCTTRRVCLCVWEGWRRDLSVCGMRVCVSVSVPVCVVCASALFTIKIKLQ